MHNGRKMCTIFPFFSQYFRLLLSLSLLYYFSVLLFKKCVFATRFGLKRAFGGDIF